MNMIVPVPNQSIEYTPSVQGFLAFSKVFKSFQHDRTNTPVVDNVSLDIRKGEFVAFLGPSGCGKTTLLNMAAGLLKADSGLTLYDSQPVEAANTRVGYLTQADALLPWRTVLSNVTLPLEVRRVPRPQRRERALQILDKVGLTGFARHFPGQLSGGMRKRAALARTLVYAPETLLLDEPFSALDAQTRLLMQQQLRRLADDLGLTIVLVTHDLDEAVSLADRIVVFSRRPARVLADLDVTHETSVRGVSLPTKLHERIWSLLSRELDGAAA